MVPEPAAGDDDTLLLRVRLHINSLIQGCMQASKQRCVPAPSGCADQNAQ